VLPGHVVIGFQVTVRRTASLLHVVFRENVCGNVLGMCWTRGDGDEVGIELGSGQSVGQREGEVERERKGGV